MSQENVEVVLEANDAFNRRDPDAFVACLRHDVEWEALSGITGIRGVYRGWTEAREWFEDVVKEVWESAHAEVAEITELGDGRLFVGWLTTARGGSSGVETQFRAWTIFSFMGGKIARRQAFRERGEALEAAGLSE
jgi:ketosteroid isomerase-like protein